MAPRQVGSYLAYTGRAADGNKKTRMTQSGLGLAAHALQVARLCYQL
jgi:hypothetical protein